MQWILKDPLRRDPSLPRRLEKFVEYVFLLGLTSRGSTRFRYLDRFENPGKPSNIVLVTSWSVVWGRCPGDGCGARIVNVWRLQLLRLGQCRRFGFIVTGRLPAKAGGRVAGPLEEEESQRFFHWTKARPECDNAPDERALRISQPVSRQ